MKKIVFSAVLLIITAIILAQVPNAFNYQAILRDTDGTVKANEAVTIQINILQGDPGGPSVYLEVHDTQSNEFGLVNLVIGEGTTSDDLSDVDWSGGPYFIGVSINGVNMGTGPLLSVPYAMHASTSGNVDDADADPTNELQTLTISGTVLTLSNDGGTVTLLAGGEGGDNWGTQAVVSDVTLSGEGTPADPLVVNSTEIMPAWSNLQGIPEDFADGTDDVDDADNNITNEIQTLSIEGSNLTLSGEGGTVEIPGDDWGTQAVVSDASLSGNGTTASPLILADNGVTSLKIDDGTVGSSDLANNAVTVAKLPAGATANTYLRGDGTWAIPSTGIADETDPTWSGDANQSASIGRTGRVGIGTTSPGALLHTYGTGTGGGNVLFVGETKSTSPGNPPVSGAGTRMMWYPDRAAFRAGQVEGTEWDAANIGESSTAIGYHTIASGFSSTAVGYKSTASNTISTAIGNQTTASGSSSTALGNESTASGSSSTAMGYHTTATGRYSTATGYNTTASGNYSTAMGSNNTAPSAYETAIGMYNTAYEPSSTNSWYSTDRLFVIGNGSGVLGSRSNAITVLKNGNTGIGIDNPSHKLEVAGQVKITGGSPGAGKVLTSDASGVASWQAPSTGSITETDPTWSGDANQSASIGRTGRVGIGTDNPSYTLDVRGDRIRLIDLSNDWIALRTDGSADFLDISYSGGNLAIQGSTAGENIVLNPSRASRVGIRTWVPAYELDVNGSIRATGSVYYGGTGGNTDGTPYTKPDYVFEDNYRRMSTEEVDEFLKKEKHLPWMTSARGEREEHGEVVDMTRMAFETVETIENLQLQLIEMDKTMKAMRETIMSQQARIEILEKLIQSDPAGGKRTRTRN